MYEIDCLTILYFKMRTIDISGSTGLLHFFDPEWPVTKISPYKQRSLFKC